MAKRGPKPKPIDIGAKFGKLTVLREVEGVIGSRPVEVRCDCGTVKIVPNYFNLKGGQVKSCGCMHFRDLNDIIGQSFHFLTCIDYSKNEKSGNIICRCVCGKRIEVHVPYLIRGIKKSCGCLRFSNKYNDYRPVKQISSS